jgi:hypothetical protein
MSLKKEYKIEESEPFKDEFSVKNVANRPKELDYEEFQKLDEKEIGEPLISEDDIKDILVEKPNAFSKKENTTEYKVYKNAPQSKESSVIKSKDAEHLVEYSDEELITPETEVPGPGMPFQSNKYGEIEKEVIKPKADVDDEIEKEISMYENTDKLQREQTRLRKEFSDFISSPKLAGNTKSRSNMNLFSREELSDDETSVDLVDSPNYTDMTRENSMVEINRDVNGEIISIVVYCKCGEKTVINLDYYDPDLEVSDDDVEGYTGIINEDSDVSDL